MNILWFNWRDINNPDAGGAEIFTHEVGKRLVKLGNKVTLFTSQFERGSSEEWIDGINVVREGGRYTVYRKARDYYMRYKHRFDLLVDEINTRPFMTPTYADGTPVVAIIHQLAREFWFYETPFPLNLIGYYYLERRWLNKYVDVPVITVSESTKKDLLNLGLKKIFVVPEGLNVRPLDSQPQKEIKPTLIFVGRFKKAKKPDHALKAFKIVKKEIPDAQLWMIGDGYMMSRLRKMASNGVTFFGRITNEKKFELMKSAHVLLTPGVREGWGLVVTEANAMGTVAIAYDVPGLRDSVINNSTGVLVRSGDPVAMAMAAINLLKDENKRNFYSNNAIKWTKEFNWDNTAREFLRIIESYCLTDHHLNMSTQLER